MKLEEKGRLDLDAESAVLLENKVMTKGKYTFHGYADACQKSRAASEIPLFAAMLTSMFTIFGWI
jgi:hypothetical protein